MIYCLDSNIIVWGIKKQATIGQEEMIDRARKLFERIDGYEDFILIPTIVLAEILVPEPTTIRAKYLEILSKSFIIAPFDNRAAMKYAELLHGRFDEINKIAKDLDIPRQKMKADHMVIAIAIVNGANCIYSTDKGLKAFSSGFIDVKDLPPIKEPSIIIKPLPQQSLFPESNMREENEKTQENEDDTPF